MPSENQARPSFDRATLFGACTPLLLFAIVVLAYPDASSRAIRTAFEFTGNLFGSFWQTFAIAQFVVALGLALSPWGRGRFGGTSEPDIGWVRWISILLCTLLAGGGVFWSAAEPMFHFGSPPPAFDVPPKSSEAAVIALAQSHVHWGFLAWTLVGTLAAISFAAIQAEGRRLRPRALLEALLPSRRVPAGLGVSIDAIAIIAVVAGTVGPIGFLALQLSSAAELELGIRDGYLTRVTLLGALVLLYTLSAASGLDRGIQWLSRLNVVLALGLGAILLLLGPTESTLKTSLASLATYATDGLRLALYSGDSGWLAYWTLFYWGWFLGYAPIMAIFIVRISRGRSVRQVVLAVSLVAPLATNLWFGALGGTGLSLELAEPGAITGPLESHGLGAALVAIVSALPGSTWLVPLFVLLVFCFLATTGDSIAYAISVVISGRETPPRSLRIGWACGMGALAAALLGLGKTGIDSLQQFIVLTAAPVTQLLVPTLVTGPLGARRLLAAQRSQERAEFE